MQASPANTSAAVGVVLECTPRTMLSLLLGVRRDQKVTTRQLAISQRIAMMPCQPVYKSGHPVNILYLVASQKVLDISAIDEAK